VFHDQAAHLFPKYWTKVRKDFQFVSVGQVYPEKWEVKQTAAVGETFKCCMVFWATRGNAMGIMNPLPWNWCQNIIMQ